MPLRKMTNSEFDGYVRSKFESASQPPYDARAWSDMSKKLGHNPTIFTAKNGTVAGAVIITLLLGWLFFPRDNGAGNTLASGSSELAEIADQNLNKPEEKSNKGLDTKKLASKKTEQPKEFKTEKKLSDTAPSKERLEANLADIEANDVDVTTSAKQKELQRARERNEHSHSQASQGLKDLESAQNIKQSINEGSLGTLIPAEPPPPASAGKAEEKKMLGSPPAGIVFVAPIDPKQVDFPSDFFGVVPKPVHLEEDRSSVVILHPDTRSNMLERLSIGVLVNADLTAVKLDNLAAPGTGLGIRVGFNLTNRIAFITGVNRVNKVYDVDDKSTYTLPQEVIDRFGWPEEIFAKCTVTEIPVSLRYDFVSGKTLKIYGVAGLHSFLMDREFYEFDFGRGGGYGGSSTTSWEQLKENKHYFAVLNTAIGFEKRVTEHFSWGAELYYQYTLQGVGVYAIGLRSLGNQFLFNYHF